MDENSLAAINVDSEDPPQKAKRTEDGKRLNLHLSALFAPHGKASNRERKSTLFVFKDGLLYYKLIRLITNLTIDKTLISNPFRF